MTKSEVFSEFLRELKSKISIVAVVEPFVRLRKTGGNYVGLCPFHAEKSPSFSVSERKGIFYCFGCQKGGDAIAFLREVEGLDFREAIRRLVGGCGLAIPSQLVRQLASSGEGPNQSDAERARDLMFRLNRFAADFFHAQLLQDLGAPARDYLAGRGVGEDALRRFHIGYAPQATPREGLSGFLEQKRAPLDLAERLGLIRRQSSGYYDVFRGRIIFPVFDERGRVVAFGARSLGEGEGPKYLNSSESPIFKKGTQVYGLFTALKDIRITRRCVLVEGYMDCIALQMAGISGVIATLGTAVTEEHVQRLRRLADDFILVMDGDKAGQEAQSRAMDVFLDQGIVARAVRLPVNQDPDDFIREHGNDAFEGLLKSAPHLLDEKILALRVEAGTSTEGRVRAIEQITLWLARLNSDVARMVRMQEVARLFEVDRLALERGVMAIRRAKVVSRGSASRPTQNRNEKKDGLVSPGAQALARLDRLEERLVELVTLVGKAGARELLDQAPFGRELMSALKAEDVRRLVQGLYEVNPEGLSDFPPESLVGNVILRATILAGDRSADQENEKRELADLIRGILARNMEQRRDARRQDLALAERLGDHARSQELLSEIQELSKCLERPKEVALDYAKKN